jgi:hypothetical protein
MLDGKSLNEIGYFPYLYSRVFPVVFCSIFSYQLIYQGLKLFMTGFDFVEYIGNNKRILIEPVSLNYA